MGVLKSLPKFWTFQHFSEMCIHVHYNTKCMFCCLILQKSCLDSWSISNQEWWNHIPTHGNSTHSDYKIWETEKFCYSEKPNFLEKMFLSCSKWIHFNPQNLCQTISTTSLNNLLFQIFCKFKMYNSWQFLFLLSKL